MSTASSKKKPQIVVCQKCDILLLAKDTQRHQDFCGVKAENCRESEKEIAEIDAKRQKLRGFNTSIEKASTFLPPDAVGWEKEHSILLNPTTMENLEIQARSPVRILYENLSFIGVVWPCKEVALLKIHVISQIIPRERMITVEKLENLEKCQNLSVEVRGTLRSSEALREFLEMYFSHSYLAAENWLEIRYLGQKLAVLPKIGFEAEMSNLRLDGAPNPAQILAPKIGYRLEILEFSSTASPSENLSEIGGMFEVLRIFDTYLLAPLKNSEMPCSILVWGLAGSGKTTILRKMATILRATYVKNCEELSEIVGSPSIIFLDLNEIDKENQKAVKNLNEFLQNENICVILSVRSAENLDIGVRVRFPVEAEITVPTQEERFDILQKLAPNLSPEIAREISKTTHGFTGGDLVSLLKTAKFSKQNSEIGRFEEARKRIRPTGIRQFILEVPNVSWADIGGMHELKLEIQQAVIWPQKHPEAFERFGIDPPAG
ncbi:unnamed protein product [Caenorhabditis angaria]|uniref:AAA+ ATPase domain-containing protein n=1 Tax=Caenorhabditis angaria TaxID=860376 RepID=A0A9P1I8C0_9PELO|nr:unnamed protein product [Caenorhabditis angaria]